MVIQSACPRLSRMTLLLSVMAYPLVRFLWKHSRDWASTASVI
jgi:hypothetical protein